MHSIAKSPVPDAISKMYLGFPEAYHKEDGTSISTKVIKNLLKEIIEKEDKKIPFTDDQLSEKLNESEFHVARRTVSKYRQQLKIASSKLRREL